jgi:hypothetical protein
LLNKIATPQDYMKDSINYVNRNNEKSQKQIHQMMEVLDLVDTYRELHPESKMYSGLDSCDGSIHIHNPRALPPARFCCYTFYNDIIFLTIECRIY